MAVRNKVAFVFFSLCVFLVLGVDLYAFEGWSYLLGKVALTAFACYQVVAFFLKMDIVSVFGRRVPHDDKSRIERFFYMILYSGVLMYLMIASVMKSIG